MGYRFKKKGGEDFHIPLDDAAVIRAAAGAYGRLMPEPNGNGGKIPDNVRRELIELFREKASVLSDAANYLVAADDVEWSQ